MIPKTFLIALIVLALTTISCGVSVNLPIERYETGSDVSEDITIAAPDAGEADLTINFGAGQLSLKPGAQGALVQGTAVYNVVELKPSVDTQGGRITLESGNLEMNALPNFGDDLKNKWDLLLADIPMSLHIHAGAYQGRFELGGLSLRSLRVGDGAADVELSFSQPNKVEMETLRYETGASNVTLTSLANANFGELIFKSGAGDYTLDFSGQLLRDADVSIDSGLSQVTLIVPKGVSARVFVDGGFSNVDIAGDWEKSGSTYTLEGGGPRLTINVNLGAGSLSLRNH
jgi:hypothetical protein